MKLGSFAAAFIGSALAAFASLGAGGCSSSSSNDPTPTQVCQHEFQAHAAYLGTCYAGSTFALHDESRYVQACVLELNAPGAAPASALDQCASKIAGATGSCGTDDLLCDVTMKGSLANGSACGEGMQCQSGFCRATDSSKSPCGTCAPAIPAGAACDLGNPGCADGASCQGSLDSPENTCVAYTDVEVGQSCKGAFVRCRDSFCSPKTSTCVPFVGANAACGQGDACGAGLLCTSGVCAPRKKAGEACTLSLYCAPGLGCDGTSNTCVPQVSVEPEQACDAVHVCRVGFCSEFDPGKCPPVVADGAACTRGGPLCNNDAECIDGKCQVFDPASCK
jgi:hypothetical protein